MSGLTVGDRIQVVLVVVDAGIDLVGVVIEGTREGAALASSVLLAHGTLLPPKPKPLQVGERVRDRELVMAEILAIDGNDAWLRYSPVDHGTVRLSDLTRVDSDG